MDAFFLAVSQIDLSYMISLFLGILGGYIIGSIPGFSATMGVALFVPFSYAMPVYNAFAFLVALYCSAIFSGSIPAILIKTPGTPAAMVTIYDGNYMAKNGEAGKALGLACMASVFGGIFSALLLILFAGGLADVALKFGAQEYFALAILGISMIITMSRDNLLKGILAALFGFMLTFVGMDSSTGFARYTFSNVNLLSGIQIIPAMIGIFAISEILMSIDEGMKQDTKVKQNLDSVFSGYKDIIKNIPLLIKSSTIGTFLGALPGVGAATASIVAYNEVKRTSKEPEKLGKGVPEGIIAPESANNAVTGGALIPLLALGIPGDSVTAILLGALMIQGIKPGPELFSKSPEVVISIYITAILSYIGILLVSAVFIKWFAKLLNISFVTLSAFVIIFCILGAYALNNSYFDVYVAAIFGLIGYVMKKSNIPTSPMILAFVLGPMIEERFIMSIASTRGDYLTFFKRPISATLLIVAIGFVCFSLYLSLKTQKSETETT